MGDGLPLACPRCARPHSLDERFCSACGMPLVYVGPDPDPPTDARGRARKVDPRYTRGELVKVAGGRNLAEAELIQGILLEEGIPSMQKRTRGFDVPDFLAAGPRDILVPESAYHDARGLLVDSELAADDEHELDTGADGRATRLAIGLGVAFLLAIALVYLLYIATG
jgi:hypothetical protein